MRQCVSGFQTDINLLCIDHCREGQIEQETGKGAYSYLEAGDLRIDQRIHHNGQVTFLLCHYHGIYISFQMELASKKIPAYIKGFSVRACLINKYCTNAHFVQYLFFKHALMIKHNVGVSVEHIYEVKKWTVISFPKNYDICVFRSGDFIFIVKSPLTNVLLRRLRLLQKPLNVQSRW